MKEKITIQEIAKLSGVSVSTVSRVLNNSPSVSKEKRKRIQDVIDQHQYTPSVFARGMIHRQTKNIGVILPDISNPYFVSLVAEIQKCALEQFYSTIVFNTLLAGPESDKTKHHLTEEDYLRIVLEKQVDGVLVLGGEIDKEVLSDSYVTALNQLHKQVPVLVIGSKREELDCLFVERDLKKGVTTLVTHLTALGHHNIGFIGGERGVKITTSRVDAFRSALNHFSHPVRKEWIELTDYYVPAGYEALMRLVERSSEDLPTALVAINDSVAIGAIRAMKDKGIRCPEDIAIVSCDQFLNSDFQIPRLTTIDQHNEYLGKIAVLQLITAMNGDYEQTVIKHQPELIVRESCGATN